MSSDSRPFDPLLAMLPAPSGRNTTAMRQCLTRQRTQAPTIGTFCVSASPHISWKEEAIVPEILWEDLVFIEKLGEGLFGEVWNVLLYSNRKLKVLNCISTMLPQKF